MSSSGNLGCHGPLGLKAWSTTRTDYGFSQVLWALSENHLVFADTRIHKNRPVLVKNWFLVYWFVGQTMALAEPIFTNHLQNL
jgi:hypothetical protein